MYKGKNLKMNSQRKNVLVLPELFPKDDKDWTGVFVVDYLAAIKPYTQLWVFYSRLTGDSQKVTKESFRDCFDVYRWSYKKKVNKLLKPLFYVLWFHHTIKQVIAQDRTIDIIHSHGTILNGTLAYLLSRKLRVPFVITEHTGPFSKISKPFVKRHWAKFILKRADKVFAVSNHLKNEIVQIGVSSSQVQVTFNPVDTELFYLDKVEKSNKNILFVSRLEPFKGGLRTVKAFHKFSQLHADWGLTLCGEGPEKQAIIDYIRKNSLQHRVVLKGMLTKLEYHHELSCSDFLVFPSLHESFGLIPVEAMSSGLPIIAINSSAMPEYIHQSNGILLQTDSIEELTDAMLEMVGSLGNYKPSEIRREVVERFGIDNFGRKLVIDYESVIKRFKR